MSVLGKPELPAAPLLACVPAHKLGAPQVRWTVRRFQQGQIVFDRDASERDLMFVQSGALMAVYWTEDGRELGFSRMGAGSYLGEVAALDNGPRSVSVYARDAAEVLILEQASFLWLLDEVPELRAQVMRDLVGRIRDLTERMSMLLTRSVQQRVCGFLARRALETGQLKEDGVVAGALTHAEIANMIGANREAVSRAISALGKAGVIEAARQRIRILQPGELEAGAELQS